MGRGMMMGISGVMLIVVGLVLVLVCTNLINLCLARGMDRQYEIGMQQVLGAGRSRIMRQLLTESLMLALADGVVGLTIAYWFTAAASRFRLPIDIPVSYEFGIDSRVLIFNLAISVLAGLAFGLIPSMRSSAPAKISARRTSRLRNALICAQVCLSFVLLICAGLTLRSLERAQFADLGMVPRNALEIGFDLELQGYDRAHRRQFVRDLLQRVRSLPETEAAGVASAVPPDPHMTSVAIRVEGAAPSERGNSPRAVFASVSPGYCAALGTTLVGGRHFAESDNEIAPPVGIVNETFARRHWNGQNAIGKRFALGASSAVWIEVVGVVRDGKYRSLGESPTPFVMAPLFQSNAGLMKIVVRSFPATGGRVEQLRREIQTLDPNLPLFDVRTLEDHMRLPLFPATIAAAMFGSFGLLALMLAAIGVFGVVSFSISRRTQEIGIRIALGAQPVRVIQMIVVQGMIPVVIGIALGLIATLALTPIVQMREILYDISETDPLTFGGIAVLLGLVGLTACYLPARRISKVDPLLAIRHE